MPGFDIEDKNPSLGDPSTQTTTPLTQRQMQGAQQATVKRTQIPPGRANVGAQPASANGKPLEAEKPAEQKPEAKQAAAPGESATDDYLKTQAGALAQVPGQLHSEAEQALGFNPAHGQDWWQHQLESPVEAFFLGKHIYNAYYGAFLDPSAIERSVHDIWHQDSAVGWLLRQTAANPSVQREAALLGGTPEAVTAGAAGAALPITGDPLNIAYGGAVGARGAGLVAKFLAPSAVSAIFADRHSPTDLAWAVLPALLFGGKLPPSVAAKVEQVAPGVSKVFERLTAAKMAQEANKTGALDRAKHLQQVLQYGAMGEKKDILARAWEAGMKPLSKEQELALGRQLLDRYGTLERERVIPLMVREGASWRQVQKVWTKLMRMPSDLVHYAPAELPLVNPTTYLHELPGAVREKVEQGNQWLEHVANQVGLGPAGHAADPNVSRFRSLFGLQQTNRLVWDELDRYTRDVGGAAAKDPAEWDRINRALESSGAEGERAYNALMPEIKVVRDTFRAAAAAVGVAAEETGTIEARVHNYWPRMALLVKDQGGFRAMRRGPTLLTREPNVHRKLGVTNVDLLTESRMQVEQLYKTVADANAAVSRQRIRIATGIVDGTPWHEIEQGLSEAGGVIPEVDRETIAGIHALAATQPEVARFEAEEYAKNLIPEFSTNPWEGLKRLALQSRAVTSRRAVQDLLQSTGKDGKALAVLRPANDRAVDELRKQGYRGISVPGFNHVLVNDQYGQLLEQATEASKAGTPAALRRLADIEGTAVAMIMYSPRIHGMNMGLRLGMAFVMHPQEVSRWFGAGLLQKGGLSQLGLKGETVLGGEEYRMIPRRYGLVPPNPNIGKYTGMWADSALAKAGELFGDTDMQRTPLVRDMANSSEAAKGSSGALSVLGNARDLLWGKQSDLWSWVSDFGVMMWWIEKAAAERGGVLGGKMSEEEAARYATARANSWMGHVSPIDSNPNLHAALKTVTFAPNYWRTWGELLTGYYRNQGFGWSKDTIKYVVENEIKTAMAAVLFQQMSANALNLVFSGHTIYQNDPGNWGKLEITAPWAIEALNATVLKDNAIDPKTGRDKKGAKLTWENPIARQVTDTEQLMGLLTSSPNWSPDTFRQGFSSFGAARLSPILQAISALANVDLYRSISSDGIRYVDPNHDTLGGNPIADLLTASGDLTPFSYITQQIQQQIIQGNVGEVQGPFGMPIPQAVVNTFNPAQLGRDAARSFLVGMTGVNPPYMRSSKTQGISPSDDQYKNVHEMQTQYQQRMSALSTATLSGQMAPYQWLATYRQLSAQHAAEMKAIFKHAPEFDKGPLGLTHSWEALYDHAIDAKTGVLQPDKLRSLQHEWRSSHSSADYAAVRNELRVNDSKYPMLALYHKTLDAYDNWQAEWCQANNVDLATLHSELVGYATVYNDRNASRAWLRDHPDIGQFEAAKRSEFEAGQSHYGEAGLMFALFFNPTAADRYLLTSGETAAEVERAVQAEQVPAAP